MESLVRLLAPACLVIAIITSGLMPIGVAAEDLELVGEGQFLLLRHALAPGTGDPANFNVDDCTTQRNLSEAGRGQARRIGARIKQAGIEKATVYSSQWCRCMDTADLLGLGEVQVLPVLNSFYQRWHLEAEQTEALKQWLVDANLTKPRVLVTHQVNITALTGVFPASGEMVVAEISKDGKVEVIRRIKTN